mmetsp:Transcript_617/g.1586  ORF Transcript_617/g.1586 Transcript_617/m.1586 type:complete len:133 (-) Transcript_617:907-1305(-)
MHTLFMSPSSPSQRTSQPHARRNLTPCSCLRKPLAAYVPTAGTVSTPPSPLIFAATAVTAAVAAVASVAVSAAVAAAAAPAMAAVEEVETPVNYGKNPGAIANRRAGTAGAKTEIKKFNNNKTGNAGSIYKK